MLPAQALDISLRDLNQLELYLQVDGKKNLWECLQLQLQFYESLEEHLESKRTLGIHAFTFKFCDMNHKHGLKHWLISWFLAQSLHHFLHECIDILNVHRSNVGMNTRAWHWSGMTRRAGGLATRVQTHNHTSFNAICSFTYCCLCGFQEINV